MEERDAWLRAGCFEEWRELNLLLGDKEGDIKTWGSSAFS